MLSPKNKKKIESLFLYDKLHKTYSFFNKISMYEILKSYSFCFGLLLITIFSYFILKNPVLAIAASCATISGTIVTFLQLRKKHHIILPENMLNTPAFIVSNSGQIIRANEHAADLIALYGSDLQAIMTSDGFDDGAVFRLFKDNKSNLLKHNDILYSVRVIESEKNYFLVSRTKKGEYYAKIYDDFAKNSGTIGNIKSADNPLNKTSNELNLWLKQDSELQNFINKNNPQFITNSSDDITNLVSFIDMQTGEALEFNTKKLDISDNKKLQAIFIPHNNHIDISKNIISNLDLPVAIIDMTGKFISKTTAFKQIFNDNSDNKGSLSDYFNSQSATILNLAIKNTDKSYDITMNNGTDSKTITIKSKKIATDLYMLILSEQNISVKDDANIAVSSPMMDEKFYQIQKMQAVGQLAGGVAHDFNNLLTAILGHTELLMERIPVIDANYSDLKQIWHNAQRAGNLVKRLLAFSRQQTLNPDIVHLTDILPDLNGLLRRLLGEKITIKTHYDHGLSPIKIDVTQLEQILMNLAVNAKDAMQTGGLFSIEVKNITHEISKIEGYDIMPVGEYVGLYISDSGIGIPKEVIGKIFEPFFTTKELGQGTGLGLSTVYGIVKQSNGFIFVDSNIGQGTCFKIYFPICNDENITKEYDNNKNITSEAINNDNILVPHTKTILIAEDEQSVREFVVKTLTMRGYNIFEADCGEDALEIFNQNRDKIDLILSDVMMPGMDGPTWVKQANLDANHTKVIFMSGYAEDSLRNDPTLKKDGIDAIFMAKPFSLKQLSSTIKNVLLNNM